MTFLRENVITVLTFALNKHQEPSLGYIRDIVLHLQLSRCKRDFVCFIDHCGRASPFRTSSIVLLKGFYKLYIVYNCVNRTYLNIILNTIGVWCTKYVFASFYLRICLRLIKVSWTKLKKKNNLNAFCTYTYKNLWFKSVHFNTCSTDRFQFF